MTNSILELARREETELLARLAAVRQLILAYGGQPFTPAPGFTVAAKSSEPVRRANDEASRSRASWRTEQAIEIIERSLDARGNQPIPLKDALALIEANGISVGGKKPASTLSAMLSNSGKFVSERGVGWCKRPVGNGAERKEPPTTSVAGGSKPEVSGAAIPKDLLG